MGPAPEKRRQGAGRQGWARCRSGALLISPLLSFLLCFLAPDPAPQAYPTPYFPHFPTLPYCPHHSFMLCSLALCVHHTAAELKFNCFFLMPLVDAFPARLREQLEAAYDEVGVGGARLREQLEAATMRWG